MRMNVHFLEMITKPLTMTLSLIFTRKFGYDYEEINLFDAYNGQIESSPLYYKFG